MGNMKKPHFLIVSEQRSGTNMTTRLLGEHPDLKIWPEPFCHPGDFGMNRKWLPKRMIARIWNQVNGCAIHRGETLSHHWRDLWVKLAQVPDLKVVDLKRENLLRRYVSLLVAIKLKNWIDPITKPDKLNGLALPTVTVDPALAIYNFNKITELNNRTDDVFQGCDVYFTTYERLTDGGEINTGEVANILSFLGVRELPLSAQTFKRERRSLKNSIANYKELKTALSNTQWSSFFDD